MSDYNEERDTIVLELDRWMVKQLYGTARHSQDEAYSREGAKDWEDIATLLGIYLEEGGVDATPNEELRELVESYRGRIERLEDEQPQAAWAYAEVAVDLRELLDDE